MVAPIYECCNGRLSRGSGALLVIWDAVPSVTWKEMCTPDDLIRLLLPHSTDLALTSLDLDLDREEIIVAVTSVQAWVTCPHCDAIATRVHSQYQRTLADLPWADFTVRI